MGSSSGNLALVSRGELGKVTVVVTLPVRGIHVSLINLVWGRSVE